MDKQNRGLFFFFLSPHLLVQRLHISDPLDPMGHSLHANAKVILDKGQPEFLGDVMILTIKVDSCQMNYD